MNYEFLQVGDGAGDATLMHIQSTRSIGSTTIDVDSVVNVPDKFIGTYGTLLASGLIDPTTKVDFTGHVSGADLIIDDFMPGSVDDGNDIGQVVVIKPNTPWANEIAAFIMNATGFGTPEDVQFHAVTATAVTSSGDITGGTSLKLSGAAPTIEATNAGANISMNIKSKGTGTIKADNVNVHNGYDYVASGLVITGDSLGATRLGSITAGVVVISGKPVPVGSVTGHTFSSIKDTYVDVGIDGVVDYTEATNNDPSPALAANHIRIGIVVTGASSIASAASINQGQPGKTVPTTTNLGNAGIDSLGNKIRPRDDSGVLRFKFNTNLGGGGDFISATLPLLRSYNLDCDLDANFLWQGVPAVPTYLTLTVGADNLAQNRIDVYATNALVPNSGCGQIEVAAGSIVVKGNIAVGGGSVSFSTGTLQVTATPV